MFSRWYLNSYPVNIWNRQSSLLVVGFPQGDVTNYYTSIKTQYVRPIVFGFLAAVCINVLLMLYLFVRNAHRIEKAMEPILNGIRHLSSGHPIPVSYTHLLIGATFKHRYASSVRTLLVSKVMSFALPSSS